MTSWTTYTLSAFALLACSTTGHEPSSTERALPPKPSESDEHRDEPEHSELPTRVKLDGVVIADAKIRTAPVGREKLASILELPGEVTSDPDRTAQVSAAVGGRIQSVHFKEGQIVKQGSLLAIIQVPELGKTQATYAATRARALAARTNAGRLEALGSQRLAGNQEVLAANAEADALDAEAHAAAEQLRALGTRTGAAVVGSELPIRAPLAGMVIARDAVVGQPVSTDHSIATIANLAEVWFLARIFEKDLYQVRVGAPVEMRLNAYPTQTFSGTVEYIGEQIDPSARTVTARVRLANRDQLLRLGLFGIARIRTGEMTTRTSLVVPRSAVTEIGHRTVVFVKQSDGDFELHEVVLGESGLGKVEIVNGLRDGEQVVVDGVFTLKSAVLKSTFGEQD